MWMMTTTNIISHLSVLITDLGPPSLWIGEAVKICSELMDCL